jgi:hypothetical protein
MSLPSPPLTAGSEENPLPGVTKKRKAGSRRDTRRAAINAINGPTRSLGRAGRVWYISEMKPGLYANINARRKAGTSRPKSKSTISPRIWRMMKAKRGGFSEKSKG